MMALVQCHLKAQVFSTPNVRGIKRHCSLGEQGDRRAEFQSGSRRAVYSTGSIPDHSHEG